MTEAEKNEALAAFKALEWERTVWQGVCPFRRHSAVRCKGTDGRIAAVGPPRPVPHSDACPYSLLVKAGAQR